MAVGFSLLMDPDFIIHYLSFGSSVGAGDSLLVKLLGFPGFLEKMWSRVAGTYFLADVRPMLIFGAIGFLFTILSLIFPLNREEPTEIKKTLTLLIVPPSLAVGMIFVGKYGPPTITFFLPSSYLLFAFFLDRLKRTAVAKKYHRLTESGFYLLLIMVSGILFLETVNEVSHSLHAPAYSSYIDFLEKNIDGEGRVLSNLNTAFAFDSDRLVIWRDLDNLAREKDSLKTFLQENDVRWIVYSRELDLIYSSRPVWNALYGNIFWYPQLMDILEQEGIVVARGNFPEYAMRIVPFMEREPWNSVIYRIQK